MRIAALNLPRSVLVGLLAGGTMLLSSGAALGASTRWCDEVPRMIQNEVWATPNVSCGGARRLMHELLGGSKACYPHGYTANTRCTLDGFLCSAHYNASAGTSS